MYHGQVQQDKFLNENLFKNRKGGFFVDVGAHDGVTINNTVFFERELEWRGICIEPIPERFKELAANRNCECLRGCAYEKNTTLPFTRISGYAEMLSGIAQSYPDAHRRRISSEMQQHGGTLEEIQVRAFRLESVFDLYNVTHVNYLSIDTEGAELQVVRGINFEKVTFDVIEFEENYPGAGDDVRAHLRAHGYEQWGAIGGENFFLRTALLSPQPA